MGLAAVCIAATVAQEGAPAARRGGADPAARPVRGGERGARLDSNR